MFSIPQLFGPDRHQREQVYSYLDSVAVMSRWIFLIPFVYECSAKGKFAMHKSPVEVLERQCAKDCVDTDAEIDRILKGVKRVRSVVEDDAEKPLGFAANHGFAVNLISKADSKEDIKEMFKCRSLMVQRIMAQVKILVVALLPQISQRDIQEWKSKASEAFLNTQSSKIVYGREHTISIKSDAIGKSVIYSKQFTSFMATIKDKILKDFRQTFNDNAFTALLVMIQDRDAVEFTSCAFDAVVEKVLADLKKMKVAVKRALRRKKFRGLDATFTADCREVAKSFFIFDQLLQTYDDK